MSNVVKTEGGEPNDATTSNTFGKSVESQGQIADANLMSAPQELATEKLSVYRLVPIAEANDPRWGNSPYQGEVLVAARISGDARIVAAGRELDYMDIDAAPAKDVTTSNASAFRNEKLYTVVEIDRDRIDLARGVLEGNISVDTIRPAQK